jgi:CelD/BcsL family acetyltransferase involved in cellulose biosynthesis
MRVAAHWKLPKRRPTLGAWERVWPYDLPQWNERLLNTASHLHQYPFWNESLKLKGLIRPKYLVYRKEGRAMAFVAILTSGVPPAAFGLIRLGPVTLDRELAPDEALRSLIVWARRRGYMFLRITHSDPQWVAAASALSGAQKVEPFPIYPSPNYELRVELLKDEDKLLASFQNVVRREIRKCAEIGYQIHSSDSPELLVQAWPIFLKMCERKRRQFYRRSVESYRSLVQLAKAHNCAKLYTAHLGSRLVQAILVVRDYDTGHYIAGALDVDALCGQKPSPSCLLHWTAMKDLIRGGGTSYDLGLLGVGSLHIFKNKFHPARVDFPPPVTIPINPLFHLWMKVLPGIPMLYSISTKVGAASGLATSLVKRYAGWRKTPPVSESIDIAGPP